MTLKIDMELRHLIGITELERVTIDRILDLAESLEPVARREQEWHPLKDRLLATVFFEPSTRTRLSFESAMQRLGGGVLSVADALRTSSAWKGESLADTIKTIDSYADAIVLRHGDKGAAREAASVSRVPILNAGDGGNEHPTQTLLDLLTIRREKQEIDGLRVTLVGDLKHTRSTNSLAMGLAKYDVDLTLVSPPGFEPSDQIRAQLDASGTTWRTSNDLASGIENADVVYVCRIQAERIADPSEAKRLAGSYVVDRALLNHAKRTPIIMHHMPRVGELAEDVDEYPGAAYFRQPWNGVLVRMALLLLVLRPDALESFKPLVSKTRR